MDGLVAHLIDAEEHTDDVRIKQMLSFSNMVLSEPVCDGLQHTGFVNLSDIQAAAIPFGKSGLDLLVQSKSDTGRTLIFGTILLEAYSCNIQEPQSLVIVPAREIAVQIEGVLNHLGRFCQDFRAVSVIGGLDVVDDRKRLDKAKAIVGTPGRLLHLINNEMLKTSAIHLLILVDVENLYTTPFRTDLFLIQCSLPWKRKTIACSATFCNNLDQKLARIMRNPMFLSMDQHGIMLMGIKQFVYELNESKINISEMYAKLNAVKYIFGCIVFKQCIIFGSQSRVDSYCNYLEFQGWPCDLISESQDQKARLAKIQKFRDIETRILISTDLMSRGIDLEHVNLVINLELPTDTATYLHRIGRLGSHGIAINLIASEKDREQLIRIISQVGTQVLKFPTQCAVSDPEKRDFRDFSDFSGECEHYGHQTENSSVASLSSATTGSIDKADFVLSATPTQTYDSIEELQSSSLNPDVVSPPSQCKSMLTQLIRAQTVNVNVGAQQLPSLAVGDSINAPAARGVSSAFHERASSSKYFGSHIHEVENVDYEEDESVCSEVEGEEEDEGEEEEEGEEEQDYEEEDYGEEEEDFGEEEEDYEECGSSTENSESALVESDDYEEYDADEKDENYSEEYDDEDKDGKEEIYFENEDIVIEKHENQYTEENTIQASLLKSQSQHSSLNAENQSQHLNPSVASATDMARRVYEAARAAVAAVMKLFENEKPNKQNENQPECSETPPQANIAAGNDVAHLGKWSEIYWK